MSEAGGVPLGKDIFIIYEDVRKILSRYATAWVSTAQNITSNMVGETQTS